MNTNINKAILAAELLISGLKVMKTSGQDSPQYADLKKSAYSNLNALNYNLQTVI